MKILPIVLIVCLFAACTKDPAGSGTPPVASASVVTSVSIYDTGSHIMKIDSFEYDANNRLQSVTRIVHDSSQIPAYSGNDKSTFSYQGNDSLPVAVTFGTDVHILEYNAQKQIIKDSGASSYTYYFNYGNSMLYTTLVLPPSVGNYQDTITLQGGNVASRNYWFFMPGARTYHTDYSFSYSALANPLHSLKNTGLFLYCLSGKDIDYISANLSLTSTANGTLIQTNTWTSSGQRVTGGIASVVGHTLLISFHYK